MATRKSPLVARLLWIIPIILLFLTIDQANVAMDLRKTMQEGRSVMAEVVALETTNRVDVTMASIRLRLPEGVEGPRERELSLPITLANRLVDADSLEVHVISDSDQEIVIAEIGRAQWRLAAINSAMSLLALILVTIGVFAWNRYLRRQGDPADAPAEEPPGEFIEAS